MAIFGENILKVHPKVAKIDDKYHYLSKNCDINVIFNHFDIEVLMPGGYVIEVFKAFT